MHELGIAQDFWAVIKQHADQHQLKKITKITIVLGEASGIEDDFLRHSLKDHVLQGTMGKDAELEFVRVPLKARCTSCERMITKDDLASLACPGCGSAGIEIASGKETYVQSIEGE
jgi:hydrogenase nickel incorporation protein HypA/HybF